eukprot:255923_1
MMAQTNSHLRSLLQVKSLLNDTQDNVLSSCIQRLFDIFGSNRNILEILIKCSTETQLNTMKNVIEEAIAVTNKVGASKHSQHNFCQISNPSISNIISFLNKDDIKQFKLTSIRIGILCLEIMDTKPHKIINIMCSKPNISLISTASFISKINERGLLVQQWNKHANDITSKGQSYIMQASANKCDTTNIEQCGCIERLTIIFSYVNKWNLDDIDSILHIFEHLNKYSVQEFVNDLDHIRQHHDTLVNQQLFCKKINYCDRIKCNFQDRSSMIRTIEHSVFNNQIHEETFSHFKFIQEAHLYLFHSLPITYNYNSNGRHEIQRLIKEYNDYNAHRSNRFVDQHHNRNDTCSNHNDSPTASHSPKTSKTIQIIDTSILMDDCIEDEKEYKQDLETISSPLFSYGNRFEYNPHKNCKKNPYYVGCAYENLKKELLDDMNKKFNIKQWNSLIHTSSTLFEMPFSKQLKSNNNKNKCISKGRILAIRLYCSHGTLASALKKTYRESKIKTKAQQKRQHSKFGHWARLLSTTCDLFGINMTQEHNCYRGLNDVYIFKSGFSCKLYGPISTTRQLAVASAFAGNGIILKIEKASFCSNAKFFECNPYSNYKSEHELLFDGHSNYLDVTGIYTSSIGTVHAQYDTKPVLLLQALTSKCNIDIGILIRLSPYITKKLCEFWKKYKEKKDEEDYILETIRYYITHWRKLDMKMKQIEDLIYICNELDQMDICKDLLSYLIPDVDLLINQQSFNIDLFESGNLFPNTRSISFDMGHSDIKLSDNINSTLWMNFIKYMSKPKSKLIAERARKKFHRIVFRKLTQKMFPNETLLAKIQTKIQDSKWNIYIGHHVRNENQKSILFLYGSNVNDMVKSTAWRKLK